MSNIAPTTGWDRALLICKPEQSGKTFVMIQMINAELGDQTDTHTVINFIFCDNSLLLTKQTGARVNRDVDKLPGTDEKYVEFSSRKDGEAQRNARDVIYKITMHDIRNVICCTNGKRVSDITSIIRDLNRSPLTRGKFIFKIWLDEADKFTKFIGKTFKPMLDSNENVELYCLTATPKSLIDKYHYMNVLPLETTTHEDYHGWEDNDRKVIVNETGTVEGFIHDVLSNHTETINPGSKWYVPANRTKKSHGHVRDILKEKGFAVFVVNGDGLALTMPTGVTYLEEKNEELNIQMIRMYRDYKVAQFPVAITGDICVGRGISIMSPDFIFDFGILSGCTKKAESSQKAGRMKGNIKSWPGYKAPTVYTTSEFDAVATEWEIKSRRLAVLAFEKMQDGEVAVITKSGYKTLGEDHEYIRHPELFKDMKAVRAFLATKVIEMGCDKPPKPQGVTKTVRDGCGGYAVSTKLITSGKTWKDLTASDRITVEKANTYGESRHITTKNNGSRFLVLPVYESLETPPDKEKYQVRYLKLKV